MKYFSGIFRKKSQKSLYYRNNGEIIFAIDSIVTLEEAEIKDIILITQKNISGHKVAKEVYELLKRVQPIRNVKIIKRDKGKTFFITIS